MPHFFSEERALWITTNYKVMFSRVRSESGYLRFSRQKYALQHFQRKIKRQENILLVRNPYDRLLSFYKDKFIKTPENISLDYYTRFRFHNWYFPDAFISVNDNEDTVKNKLSSATFLDFLNRLTVLFDQNIHTLPQHFITKYHLNGGVNLKIPVNFTQKIKIDDRDEMDLFSNLSGIDISKKINTTSEFILDNSDIDNKNTYEIINKLYIKDFECFNYPIRNLECCFNQQLYAS